MENDILEALEKQKISSQQGWKIYFDKERLIMYSGKMVWEERHHALNALIRSCKDMTKYPTTRENNIAMQDYIKQLVLDGRIEFIK
jgi:hypothetical protein